jgi:hypothetical protein
MPRENQNSQVFIEKERKARRANAEKQKRYRESMKAQGYRARLVWEKPLESGWVRIAAPIIRESSLGIAGNNPAFREVLENLSGTFISDCKKKKIPNDVWEPVYKDIQVLLKPLLGEIDGY